MGEPGVSCSLLVKLPVRASRWNKISSAEASYKQSEGFHSNGALNEPPHAWAGLSSVRVMVCIFSKIRYFSPPVPRNVTPFGDRVSTEIMELK